MSYASPDTISAAVAAPLTLTGTSDVVQLTVLGDAAQTADIVKVQTSAAADVLTVSKGGRVLTSASEAFPVSIGQHSVHASGHIAFGAGATAPTNANYAMRGGGSSTLVNGPSSVTLLVADATKVTVAAALATIEVNTYLTGKVLSGYAESVKAVAATPRAVTSLETGGTFTNEGAAALQVFDLPTAVAGLRYTFIVQDADGIQVNAAAADTIRVGAAVSAAAGLVSSTNIGAVVTIVAINATEWLATSVINTWTVT